MSEASATSAVRGRGRNEVRGDGSEPQTVDLERFHALFERYERPILSFIYRLLGDRRLAEDLAQETFVRAYLNRSAMRDRSRESTWLFGIARNVVREAVREKYRRPNLSPGEMLETEASADERSRPDGRILASEIRLAIRSSFDALSPDQREVFVLKILHKMSYAEIARITGSSIGKMKTDLHRARLQMRARLRRYWDPPAEES